MSAVLNLTEKRRAGLEFDPLLVQAVHDASARLQAAEENVTAINRRIDDIEVRALVRQAERSRHNDVITAALLGSYDPPAAPPPPPIEPDEAKRILKAQLKLAEQAVVIATGDRHSAVARVVEDCRDKKVGHYRTSRASSKTDLCDVAAIDRLSARVLPPALSPLFVSRLSIPALPREDNVNGMALEGRHFFASPELADREREFRRALEAELRCALPF